ncbi:acetyl-coenzyme A synthetase [Listeria ivanovii]|uniref:DUF1214 domain-containing protein n=1 Tax=Listeria ivanovii TaxID=1638 RepID=UPI000DA6E271|nr:DUF1254 domain-containing protein [Listeria ivanovii]PZF90011.1 acetyl-coenzyme A synthetase [Listeria ivanovii]PZF94399.1 acetyl-coenzyme A synthetase [Listeria ivanovii]PZG04538.1 acetyl-coenzyme A synthetase [Listeria ivanovii]PZG09591.1 acetyl-coenzyme A synthetase [Listeria ivanovii]PZG27528.1 acetyl-coenzyme A synthetase [Listeria ivanovii]
MDVNLQVNAETVKESYVYLLSRYLVLRQENFDIKQDKIPYNVLKHNTIAPADANFVNPNFDVVYSETWLAVDDNHAVILEVPEIKERYYTVQLLDGWGEVVTNINERNYPEHPFGKFAFIKKGTNPVVPDDAIKIELPAEKVKLLLRVEQKGDPEGAVKLQKQFKLDAPTGIEIQEPLEIPPFTNAAFLMEEIYDNLETVLASYPDKMPKAPEFQAKARKVAEYIALGDEQRAEVKNLIIKEAIPYFLAGAKGFGTQKGAWSVTYVAGAFENDILARSIIDFGGLWANTIDEALYFIGQTDSNKEMLSGDNTYKIHFTKEALPEKLVNSFWSITMYSVPDYHVIPNKLNKFSINNYSDTKLNDDGSLILYLAPEQPAGVKEGNWLPSEKGKDFSLNFRLYVAKQEVLEGKVFLPPLERI